MNKMYQKGDTLKLSQEGLGRLASNHIKRDRLLSLRFEYRGVTRGYPDCLTVIRKSGKGYYSSYHKDFLEKVDS